MFKEVRKKLNECHISANGEFLGVLLNAEPAYLIKRGEEEIQTIREAMTPEQKDNHLKLAIQLLNLARTKLSNAGIQSSSKRTRKRITRTASSASSKPATGS